MPLPNLEPKLAFADLGAFPSIVDLYMGDYHTSQLSEKRLSENLGFVEFFCRSLLGLYGSSLDPPTGLMDNIRPSQMWTFFRSTVENFPEEFPPPPVFNCACFFSKFHFQLQISFARLVISGEFTCVPPSADHRSELFSDLGVRKRQRDRDKEGERDREKDE